MQLTICKVRCEKRIRLLGGPDYKGYGEEVEKEEEEKIPGKKASRVFFFFFKEDETNMTKASTYMYR
jgi:hypothetical protein